MTPSLLYLGLLHLPLITY